MQHNLNEMLIRSKLANYLTGKISLRVFHKWFVAAAWDVDERAPKRLQKLVYGIKLRLAEYTNGHWSKAELRDRLLPFLTSAEFSIVIEGGREEVKPRKRSAGQTVSFSPPAPRPFQKVSPHRPVPHGQLEVAFE